MVAGSMIRCVPLIAMPCKRYGAGQAFGSHALKRKKEAMFRFNDISREHRGKEDGLFISHFLLP